MSFPNDAGEKISTAPLLRDPLHVLALATIVLQILIAIGTFPFLPVVMPIRWNIAGHADGYGPKWLSALLFPLLSVGIYLLMHFVALVSPRLGGHESQVANASLRMTVLIAVLLFLLIMQLCVTTISLAIPIDLIFTLNLTVSVLFIVLGNFMGKMRRNFWMGIRTPWTLTSDVAWERTHRLGGWLFVAVGLIGIPCSFLPALRIWVVVLLSVLVAIVLCIYSYVCYQQRTRREEKPGPSSFEETNDL